MLHALLVILKILLWIILAIIGLVLLLVLLVLFSPIKYKIDAKYHGAALVNAKISFLIATVRVMFDQQTKKLDYSIRLAGIKLNLDKEKKPKRAKKSKKTEDMAYDEDVAVENPDASEIIEPVENVEHSNTDTPEVNNIEEPDIKDATDHIDSTDDIDEIGDIEEFDLFDDNIEKDVPKEHRSLLGRIKAFFTGIKNKLINIKQKAEDFSPEQLESKLETKLNKAKKFINKLKKFWNLKCTVKTRNYLKKYLVGLVKHIGPRSIKGYVRYGFGDPCKTGQVTGYLSLLPFVYSKHFSLEPDFYEKIIDTELLIKGRIRIGYILRIVLNINIWRTILVAGKIFKGKKKEV